MDSYKRISSRDNEFVKQVSRLQTSARVRRQEGLFVAEGLRICKDCVDNKVSVETLVITENFLAKNQSEVEQIAAKSADVVLVTESVFAKMSDTKTPQGILAVIQIPTVDATKIEMNGRYIALENLQDPSNLGAVCRTAEALGISGIILSSDGCDPFGPKSLRASMGTILRMPIVVTDDFTNLLKNSGMDLYACVVSGGEPINNVEFKDGSIVVIGNEANGITNETKEICRNITIPMSGRAESLNASVAASIAMWELIK